MSCSSNEAAGLEERPAARLGGALAASAALHALLAAGVSALIGGGDFRWFRAYAPLHVTLRAAQESVAPGTERPGEARASVPAPRAGPPGAPERLPLPAPRYYTTRELDVVPGIRTRVEPEYPETAARRFLSGKVVVRLFIDEQGKVERVTTLRADPPGYFEASAERAFGAATFTPAMKDGKSVKAQLTLEVSFDSPQPSSAPGS